jgi:hypothetical protein
LLSQNLVSKEEVATIEALVMRTINAENFQDVYDFDCTASATAVAAPGHRDYDGGNGVSRSVA